ncbi:MAG: Methyltransferase type 11 [Eubacterium sp.]|nr:Methyltransferase type 11 [Eubacterium sp.]
MEKSIAYKRKSQISFDNQADSYDSTYYGQHAQRLYDRVIETMNKYEYKNVLDVGCGTGYVLAEIIKQKPVETAGIDLSEKMLDIAKRRIGNEADLRNGDSEHLPWNSDMFDIVICTDSFHHYPNTRAVLNEMRRVLSPTGKLVIADPWIPSPLRQFTNLFLPFSKDGDVKIYSKTEMKRMFINCNLQAVSWEKVGKNAFVTVAEKKIGVGNGDC